MSNRTTPQEGEESWESRTAPDFSKFMVHDSFTNSISSPAIAGEERRRLTHQQLVETANSGRKCPHASVPGTGRYSPPPNATATS